MRAFAEHVDGRILDRALGTEVAVDPFHDGAFVGERTFGHEVVDVGGPVLNRGVTAPRAFLHEDLHNRRV